MSAAPLILRGRARALAVALTAPLVVGLVIGAVVIAGLVESPAVVLLPLALAGYAAWLAFQACDNWFGWLSIVREDSDWVISRGSAVRRPAVLRLPAARITLVEIRLEERAPVYAILMGPRRENGLMSYGPIVRVHLDAPPVGAKLTPSYVDLGKWLDLSAGDLERLRVVLAGPS